jgi:hypothetical protein
MLPDPGPYFAHRVDPRRETRNTLHKLEDLLMIVFSAALSGIEDWVGMEEFGNQKQDWLKSFPDLTNGIPSHDFAKAVRRHRDIENGQHWVLDVQFDEDANRACKDRSAENLTLIQRMALNK